MGEEIWTLIRLLPLSFSFSTLSWRSFQAAPMAVLSLEEVLVYRREYLLYRTC